MRWSLVFRVIGAVTALAAAALCLGLAWLGGAGARAYQAADHSAAADRYHLAAGSMPLERWKALFGEGTAMLAGGDAAAAEGPLSEAARIVPAGKECVVRINWSLAQERQGDEAAGRGATDEAIVFYETALATLREAGCPSRDDVAAEAERRLEEKLDELGQDSGSQAAPDGATDPNSGDTPDDPENLDDPADPDEPQDPSASGSPSSSSDPNGGAPSPSPSPSPDQSQSSEAENDSPKYDAETQRKLDELAEQAERAQRERDEYRQEGEYYESHRDWDSPIW
ncbi:MAG: hypothetical protein LBD97_00460 [Bifidobacteriaceae bacterium]|jgi:tetratricopeptide (TPR) repeat protein|nr:hypothetical protein [Bifidobacteriaceae bacterium]